MGDGDLEENGRFFVGYGCLGYEFRSERVVPGEVHADFGQAEFEELELTKVCVEEVAGCLKGGHLISLITSELGVHTGHVTPRTTDGVLTTLLEGSAFS